MYVLHLARKAPSSLVYDMWWCAFSNLMQDSLGFMVNNHQGRALYRTRGSCFWVDPIKFLSFRASQVGFETTIKSLLSVLYTSTASPYVTMEFIPLQASYAKYAQLPSYAAAWFICRHEFCARAFCFVHLVLPILCIPKLWKNFWEGFCILGWMPGVTTKH